MVATKKAEKSNGQAVKIGAGRYPLIPLKAITLPERPEEGQEHTRLFYNPRFIESFDSASMEELRNSIIELGLIHPPSVRIHMNGNEVAKIELIAGERRYRSIMYLVENEIEVFDKDLGEMVNAAVLYAEIPCCVHYDLSDEKALRYACDENGQTRTLTVAEEIALVERLIAMGYSTEKIIELTGQHPSWVSHTSNFRSKLPPQAFEMLLEGKLSRNVAVRIIGFPEESRSTLLQATIEAEREATEHKLEEVNDELSQAEDLEQLAEWEEEKALQEGDEKTAKKAEKVKRNAHKRKEKAQSKKTKIEANAGVISQGDLEEGARIAHVSPKTPKQLSKQDIDTYLIEPINSWIEAGEYVDDMYEQEVGQDVLRTIKAVAEAIVSGERDPVILIRKVMIATDEWEDETAMKAAEADSEALEEDDYEDEFEENEFGDEEE